MATETIKLKHSVTIEGSEVDTLQLRRPRVIDIKMVSKIDDQLEATIRIMSQLCTVPPDVIESLDMEDFGTLERKVSGFLESGREKSGQS